MGQTQFFLSLQQVEWIELVNQLSQIEKTITQQSYQLRFNKFVNVNGDKLLLTLDSLTVTVMNW
jgi:hypothetical protein